MSKDADIKAMLHFLTYAEQEAIRLGLPPVVAYCLRVAAQELTKSTTGDTAVSDAQGNRAH